MLHVIDTEKKSLQCHSVAFKRLTKISMAFKELTQRLMIFFKKNKKTKKNANGGTNMDQLYKLSGTNQDQSDFMSYQQGL